MSLIRLGLTYDPPLSVIKKQSPLDRAKLLGSIQKGTLTDWLHDNTGRPSRESGLGTQRRDNPNYSKLVESYRGWVYSAVTMIGNRLADLDYTLAYVGPDSTRKPQERHVALDLLRRPNEIDTEVDIFFATAAYLQLSPEVEWVVDLDGPRKTPSRVRVLRPDCVVRVYNTESEAPSHYIYTSPTGSVEVFTPDRIVRHSCPLGMSPMMAAAEAYDLSLFNKLYKTTYYRNNARPDYFIRYPVDVELSDEFLRSVWEMIADRHQGSDKWHLPGILGDGAEITALPVSASDQAFLQATQMTRDEIFWVFGVPPAMLDQTANRAVSEAAQVVFANTVISPLATRIAARLNKDFFERYYPQSKGRLEFEFENPVPQDRAELRADQEHRLRLGLATPNDLLEEAGEKPFENGDARFLMGGLVSYDYAVLSGGGPMGGPGPGAPGAEPPAEATEPQEDIEEQPEPEQEPAPPLPPGEDGKRTRESAFVAKIPSRCSLRELWDLNAKLKTPAAYQAEIWDRHVKRLDPAERTFVRDIKDEFGKQRDRVIDQIRRQWDDVARALAGCDTSEKRLKVARKKGLADIDSVFDFDFELAQFTDLGLPHIENQFKGGLANVLRALKRDHPDFSLTRILSWIQKTNRQYADDVTRTTRARLKYVISQAIADGASVDETAGRIGTLYKGFDKWRSLTIARTELNAAENAGALEGYRQSGVVARKEWLSAIDERTRSYDNGDEFDHAGANGEVAGMEEMFQATGEPLEFPGDPNGSPGNTINCRCTHVPVIEE